jgi:chromosome segregation ATPase
MVSFRIKTTECQEWKQKYEESDTQIGQMEQAIEDLQNESYSKTKQLNNTKDKEVRELEGNLRAQFEQEMKQYQDKICKLQNEVNTCRAQNKEVASELVVLTNESSQLNLQLQQKDMDLRQQNEQMVPVAELEKAQESENYLRSRIAHLDKQLKQEISYKQEIQSTMEDIMNGKIATNQSQGNSPHLRKSNIFLYRTPKYPSA